MDKPKMPTPEQMQAIRAYQKQVSEALHVMMDSLKPFNSTQAAVILAALTDLVGEGIASQLQNGGGGAVREQWVEGMVERVNAVLDEQDKAPRTIPGEVWR